MVSRYTTSLIAIVIPFFVAACGPADNKKEELSEPAGAKVAVPEDIKKDFQIKVEEVVYRHLGETFHITGQIHPDYGREIDVTARFTGRVVSILVKPGDWVVAGQTLASVDSRDISSMLAELIEDKGKLGIALAQEERERQVYEENIQRPKALINARTKYESKKVQLELAVAEANRVEDLYREKIASQKDLLASKARLATARLEEREAAQELAREERLFQKKGLLMRDLQLAQAETSRARHHLNTLIQQLKIFGMPERMINECLQTGKIVAEMPLIAPAAGVVGSQEVAVGEILAANTRAFTILDLSVVVVKADLPETDLKWIRLGAPVSIRVASYPDEKFQGAVTYISEHVNADTRTVPIRIRIANQDRKLKANMFAEIDVVSEPRDVLACPVSAVQERDGKKIVFVQTQDGYKERLVTLGLDTEQYYEVLSGLGQGDRVVTQGSLMLKAEMAMNSQN